MAGCIHVIHIKHKFILTTPSHHSQNSHDGPNALPKKFSFSYQLNECKKCTSSWTSTRPYQMTLCGVRRLYGIAEDGNARRSLFNHFASILPEKIKTITDAIKFKYTKSNIQHINNNTPEWWKSCVWFGCLFVCGYVNNVIKYYDLVQCSMFNVQWSMFSIHNGQCVRYAHCVHVFILFDHVVSSSNSSFSPIELRARYEFRGKICMHEASDARCSMFEHITHHYW